MSKRPIETINLNTERLAYKAEGNANLVMALLDRRMVLRLRKAKECTCASIVDQAAEVHHLQRSIAYVNAISTLFRPVFVTIPQFVMVASTDCAALNIWLRPQRPVHRLDKLVCCSSGVLCPDVAFLTDAIGDKDSSNNEKYYTIIHARPRMDDAAHGTQIMQGISESDSNECPTDRAHVNTFAVEIKPKQGWLTSTDSGAPWMKCRFCSLQYLKLAKGSITRLSNYCPLDLFSGNRSRMARAINELIQNPQNNFRLFVNGSPVFGECIESDSFENICGGLVYGTEHTRKHFISVIIEALLTDFSKPIVADINFDILPVQTTPCTESPTKLPENCILNNMLTLQRLVETNLAEVIGSDGEHSEMQSATRVDRILSKVRCSPPHLRLNDLDASEQYLLGATVLDCSIMITCRPAAGGDCVDTKASSNQLAVDIDRYCLSDERTGNHIIAIDRQRYCVQVKIMDLDPKSLDHSLKYEKQLEQSRLAYVDYVKRMQSD